MFFTRKYVRRASSQQYIMLVVYGSGVFTSTTYVKKYCVCVFVVKNICCKPVETDKVKTAIFTVFKYRYHYAGGHLVYTRENR